MNRRLYLLAAATVATALGVTGPAAYAGGKRFLQGERVTSGLLSAAGTAVNGPTQSGEICMQKVFGAPVTGSNKLNCTANDVRISKAVSVSPQSCTRGTTFTLTATFETIVTASGRYDVGYFFRTDGGGNARGDGVAATGQCSLSALTPSIAPAKQLDGDTCGDLNAGTYNVTFEIPDVECTDSDGDSKLNLPNCTSWHSNQGTSCNIANAADFKPDTKSKCVCDDTFNVPVTVEDAAITVTKTAAPTFVTELGGAVTFTVNIKNDSTTASATVDTITDDVFGDLTTIGLCGAGAPSAASPGPCTSTAAGTVSCPSLDNTVIAAAGQKTCTFQAFIVGQAGTSHTDVVTACALGSESGNTACDDDDAVVSITDATDLSPTLTKDPLSASNCSMDVEYQVVVGNPSVIDTLTVDSLTDSKFGSITGTHAAGGGYGQVTATTCAIGGVIAKQDNMTCKFTGRITSTNCSIDHTNEVTAGVTDDDGNSSTLKDTATVKMSPELKAD